MIHTDGIAKKYDNLNLLKNWRVRKHQITKKHKKHNVHVCYKYSRMFMTIDHLFSIDPRILTNACVTVFRKTQCQKTEISFSQTVII